MSDPEAEPSTPTNRSRLAGQQLIVVCLVIALAVGGYFWWRETQRPQGFFKGVSAEWCAEHGGDFFPPDQTGLTLCGIDTTDCDWAELLGILDDPYCPPSEW